jgi:hypothetical protein
VQSKWVKVLLMHHLYQTFSHEKAPTLVLQIWKALKAYLYLNLNLTNLAEGMTAVSDYAASFFGVPGFAYEVKVHFDVQEALKMVGIG